MGLFGIFSKKKKETLDTGLEKTKDSVLGKISRALAGKSKVDDEVLDNLEDVLISSDVGVDTTLKIIKRIEERVARDKYVSTAELNGILRSEIEALLTESGTIDGDSFVLPTESKPYVIMVVGVNGVGKTTTIGKLAYQFKAAGHKVVIGAADTFRAAAIDQLSVWAERVDVPMIKQKMGADPASVAYDTVASAVAQDADVVLIDTAGRLHNKVGLMNELTKIKRVMQNRPAPKRAIEIPVFFSSFLCVFYSINKYGNRGRDLCTLLSIPTVSYWKSSFTLSPSGNKSPPACH